MRTRKCTEWEGETKIDKSSIKEYANVRSRSRGADTDGDERLIPMGMWQPTNKDACCELTPGDCNSGREMRGRLKIAPAYLSAHTTQNIYTHRTISTISLDQS
jgi:hypothetical protein